MDQHRIGNINPLVSVIQLVNPNTSLVETLGVNEVDVGLVVVPSSLTLAFSVSTRLVSAYFNNTTGNNVNITLQDNNGNAAVGPSFVLPPLSNLLINFNMLVFWGGVKWRGDAGIVGSLKGLQ